MFFLVQEPKDEWKKICMRYEMPAVIKEKKKKHTCSEFRTDAVYSEEYIKTALLLPFVSSRQIILPSEQLNLFPGLTVRGPPHNPAVGGSGSLSRGEWIKVN